MRFCQLFFGLNQKRRQQKQKQASGTAPNLSLSTGKKKMHQQIEKITYGVGENTGKSYI